MPKSILVFLRLLPLTLLLSGCGLVDFFYLPVPQDTAQELYEAGVDAMNATDYYAAVEYFEKLKDRYPFSKYTPKAEIGLGDAYYLAGYYQDAMDAYVEFESMHPRHPEVPYVLFQIGVSGYKTFTSIDRPQLPVAEGLQYLYKLKEGFPDSKYAPAADDYILKCRRILAERELFVADFYLRTDKYGGAWQRFQFVVDNFADIPDVYEYASRQAEFAYLKHQEHESQEAMEETHGAWNDYFEWL